MTRVISFFIITLCLSCATGTSKLIDKEKLNFSYTDDAYLFFRNMRQAQYERSELEKEGLRLYQHEDFSQDQLLKTTLVVNWKFNKAYILLDFTDTTVEKYDIKIFYQQENGAFEEVVQENLRRQGEAAFMTDVYNHLLSEKELFLEIKGQNKQKLFSAADDREAFRVSMYDFYRLTGVL